MTKDELEFLQKCYAASGALLQGATPTADEYAALDHLITKITPIVKRLRIEQALVAASNGRSETLFGGRFFH